jgi:hypothetical protein
MKIRNMLGLTLLGTALYAHKQRGGELTIDSFKKSLKDLLLAIKNEPFVDKAQVKLRDAAFKAKVIVEDAAENLEQKAKRVTSTTRGFADDIGGYGADGNGTPRR